MIETIVIIGIIVALVVGIIYNVNRKDDKLPKSVAELKGTGGSSTVVTTVKAPTKKVAKKVPAKKATKKTSTKSKK